MVVVMKKAPNEIRNITPNTSSMPVGAKNMLSISSTILGSILLDEEENVVVPLIGIRLDVPLFDVFPFSDGFPMSYLLKE